MKVRKPRRCARCRVWMESGSIAHRYLGGYWHASCIRHYEQARQERKAVA